MDACRLRLRPILMTSFAFILGVVPLVLGQGAGAEMRFTLGVAVFSGMLGVTAFGIFFTPIFYYIVGRFSGRRQSEVSSSFPVLLTADFLSGRGVFRPRRRRRRVPQRGRRRRRGRGRGRGRGRESLVAAEGRAVGAVVTADARVICIPSLGAAGIASPLGRPFGATGCRVLCPTTSTCGTRSRFSATGRSRTNCCSRRPGRASRSFSIRPAPRRRSSPAAGSARA